MKKGKFDITFILDRSGSMETIRDDVVGGYNSFLKDQKEKVAGEKYYSLIQFDDQYERVYIDMPENLVPLLTRETFEPRGWTALVDAVCRTIEETRSRLDKLPQEERPEKVMFVIVTDGFENSSREYTSEKLKGLITRQRDEHNWQFIYLGANQDAWQVAQQYGIPASSSGTFAYCAKGTTNAFNASSSSTTSWLNGVTGGCLVSPEQLNEGIEVTSSGTPNP